MRTAYAIGHTLSYDKYLAEHPGKAKKLGARNTNRFRYDGGWIWQTADEAEIFRTSALSKETLWDFNDFSVYELELPNGWEQDVSQQGNEFYLQEDALIKKKIYFDNPA